MDLLRQRLLGKAGPYADLREATDQIDNIGLWIRGLSRSEQVDVWTHWPRYMVDDDLEVATVAVLAVEFLADVLDVASISRILNRHDQRWFRQPFRFNAVTYGTLFEEFFARVCQACHQLEHSLIENVLHRTTSVQLKASLLSMLGKHYSPIVVYHAHEMLTPAQAHVIGALPHHAARLAVASACRPWPSQAIERVVPILKYKNVHAQEIATICRVMRDAAPELMQPFGQDLRWWWMVAVEPDRWTMWKATNGQLAIEHLIPGRGLEKSIHLLSETEAMLFIRNRTIPEPT